MNITAIIIAAAAVGGTGILVGLILGIAGDRLKVEVDEEKKRSWASFLATTAAAAAIQAVPGLLPPS